MCEVLITGGGGEAMETNVHARHQLVAPAVSSRKMAEEKKKKRRRFGWLVVVVVLPGCV